MCSFLFIHAEIKLKQPTKYNHLNFDEVLTNVLLIFIWSIKCGMTVEYEFHADSANPTKNVVFYNNKTWCHSM